MENIVLTKRSEYIEKADGTIIELNLRRGM